MSNQTLRFLIATFLVVSIVANCHSEEIAQEQNSVPMTLAAPSAEMPLFSLHSLKIGTNRDGEATLEFSYSQPRPGRSILTDTVVRLVNSNRG